jgi:hypothetical protein
VDYDNLLFVDMDGNRVDGRACDIIYQDAEADADDDSRVRIVVDEHGNMVDVYMEGADDGSGSGQQAPVGPATVTVEAVVAAASASPGTGEPTMTLPESTTGTGTKSGSVVTLPPH